MKTIKLIVLSALITSCVKSVHAQQTFQNLNFEQANPILVVNDPLYPGSVTTASALPGWEVTIGGVQQTQVTLNNPIVTGSTSVNLLGSGDHFGFSPIDGNYSVLLAGGGIPGDAAISQSGLIPSGTQTLLFEAQPSIAPAPAGPLEFQIGTQTIPYIAVGTGPNYNLYAANISAWGGQMEDLTFSVPSFDGNWELDDISFSTSAVPEPNTLELGAVAAFLLALRKWRKLRGVPA